LSTEQERYDHAKNTAQKFRTDLLQASGGVENTMSAVQRIAEEDNKQWAKDLHNYMVENIHAEPIDIIEEKVRLNVLPKIEANPPTYKPPPAPPPTRYRPRRRRVQE